MARQRHLPNAPITEALIDLRVRVPDDLEVSTLASEADSFRKLYPEVEERRLYEGRLRLRGGEGRFQQGPSEIQGYFFRSEDGTRVVQFRPDGFTFSRLRPYTNWEDIREDARQPWLEYVSVAHPELVTRVAVRYINHIPLPLPIQDFGQYLLAPPTLPEGAPAGLTGFLSRVTGRYSGSGISANVTQSLEPSAESAERVVILLDIDVFKARTNLDPGDDSAWNLLDRLRELKNDIFFGSITEPTAELFE